ncbi:class I SAM-dependent methyltransferase [Aeromonas intestinalis]
MKNFNVITSEKMNNWFSSTTEADYQLKDVITKLDRSEKFYPSAKEINLDLFCVNDIYASIPLFEPTYYGVPSNAHISERDLNYLFSRVDDGQIHLIIEVGSFCGASACFIAEYIKKNNIPALIICVDTWCGDINMWLKGSFNSIMGTSSGQPKLFENFISTVRKYKMDDIVIPLRVSSVVAARMIEVLKYKVDMVYLDSAHEAGETFMELNLYYGLLKKGGVIFGDDYNIFPAVKNDVDLFSCFIGQAIDFCDNKDKNNPIWSFKK